MNGLCVWCIKLGPATLAFTDWTGIRVFLCPLCALSEILLPNPPGAAIASSHTHLSYMSCLWKQILHIRIKTEWKTVCNATWLWSSSTHPIHIYQPIRTPFRFIPTWRQIRNDQQPQKKYYNCCQVTIFLEMSASGKTIFIHSHLIRSIDFRIFFFFNHSHRILYIYTV